MSQGRPAKAGREVTISRPLVGALARGRARHRQAHRLTGEARRLAEVRRLVMEHIAALPGDDVDNGALHVAEFR